MAATQGLPEVSILRSVSDSFRLSSNSICCAACSPLASLASAKTLFMPSSIDRSAPAENASLPDVITTPLTAASAVVWSTMAPSSSMVSVSSTFIERPGMSHVTSAMPSPSVSTLKFLKAICRSQIRNSCRVGKGALAPCPPSFSHLAMVGTPLDAFASAGFAHPAEQLDPLDDRCRAHAAADAQRHQRGRFVGALQFVEHSAQDHRAGRAKGMAERDRAAIDVDLGIVDVERLDVAQHHRGKGFVELEQVDVRQLHA